MLGWLTSTSRGWFVICAFFSPLYLLSFCLVFYRTVIILPFSRAARLSVILCAVFNMLRGHMSTPYTTEQIHYFVCVHSSFGPIHVLAFCYCHAWWGFLRCPPRGRNTFQGCQLRLAFTLYPAVFLSGLLFYVVHRTWCLKNSYFGITSVPNLWGASSEIWRSRCRISINRHGRKWTWWGEVVGEVASRLTTSSASHPHLDLSGGGGKSHLRERGISSTAVCACRTSTTNAVTCPNVTYPPQHVIEVPWESVSVVLITPTAMEVGGKGHGLVCNFTGGTGWWWECPSWSQRSNLPLLAAVYPPTHCKHNGSPWYWADCCFIRARTGVGGEEFCLSLFDELVYFPCTWEAQSKLIGKHGVYPRLRKHSWWYRTVSSTPEPPQKSLIRAFWK